MGMSQIWMAVQISRPGKLSQFAIENGPVEIVDLPINSMVDLSIATPGKLSHNYGKSPVVVGKLTISMVIFNSKLLNYQVNPIKSH